MLSRLFGGGRGGGGGTGGSGGSGGGGISAAAKSASATTKEAVKDAGRTATRVSGAVADSAKGAASATSSAVKGAAGAVSAGAKDAASAAGSAVKGAANVAGGAARSVSQGIQAGAGAVMDKAAALASLGTLATGLGKVRGDLPSGFFASGSTKDALVLTTEDTLEQARKLVIAHADGNRDPVFIVNHEQELVGMVDVDKSMSEAGNRKLKDLMQRTFPIGSEGSRADLENIIKMQKQPMLIPITNAAKRILGAVDPRRFK
ncbi:MAG: hypothetical protein R2880_14680 [Deinococcales bacterium]